VYFGIENHLGVTHECDRQKKQTDERTDGRTDFMIANVALHYVASPKTTPSVTMY